MTTTELRVLASIAKNPDASDYQIAKNLKLRVAEVTAARQHPAGKVSPAPKNPVAMKSGGVELTGLRVLPRKPADSAAGYIKRLPTGRGYEPRVLAAEWGISEETIRRHAKDLKCLKFVEVNDEWVPMVMHPETAARYHA